jgi:hypothetical protein
MSEAFYALAGTLIGATAALLAELLRSKKDAERQQREALRALCAEFTSTVVRVRNLSFPLHTSPNSTELLAAIRDEHGMARTNYERIRLTAESTAIQEAGRYLVHHSFWLWKSAEEGWWDVQDPDSPMRNLDRWLVRFYTEVRKELGVRHAADVYDDPIGGIPIPGEAQRRQKANQVPGSQPQL